MTVKALLIVAHAPSPNTKKLAQAAYEGANHADLDVNIIFKSPQDTQPEDVLNADALLLGTTENLAYMAGLTKDFFDRCYYPVLEEKQGMPFALYIRAGHDGTGTKTAIKTITTGLRWEWVQDALILQGDWQDSFAKQVEEMAMALAAGVEAGIY
ncbi:flavodoxin family protein [Psychrobacter sp.]|uniref:flavodoxin family protein n=1 Tax=Psychrobacter sp. TaxID=56811 RepID=UPI002647BD90|nr:flavodoxin family protein [Psychrobacter sp.]MDN6276596.1 flavodoxin family protein [Psychrobacter sp.]MDN6308408.1 flavodoxin family protein [Psychrobacter sp.]